MKNTKIAVLMTCHNRKLTTLGCLSALFAQTLPEEVEISVYLVDDGSTDGTEDAVRQTYPQVKILSGDGSLFWSGGMRLAFSEALKNNYDYYLWLNDDTILYPNALSLLLSQSYLLAERGHSKAIVVGSTQESKNGKVSYGGLRRSSWLHPLKFRLVQPGDKAIACDTMHGNCVLIPRAVTKVVGNLDSAFIHNLADYDYGLRAQRQQCSIWLAPNYVGTCKSHLPDWQKPGLTFQNRLQKVNQPKGLLLKEWKIFAKRNAGWLWPIFWLLPYRKLFFQQ